MSKTRLLSSLWVLTCASLLGLQGCATQSVAPVEQQAKNASAETVVSAPEAKPQAKPNLFVIPDVSESVAQSDEPRAAEKLQQAKQDESDNADSRIAEPSSTPTNTEPKTPPRQSAAPAQTTASGQKTAEQVLPSPEPKPEPEVTETISPLVEPEEPKQTLAALDLTIETQPEVLPLPEFNLEQLPIIIAETWELDLASSHCTLRTLPKTMEDNAGGTPILLELNQRYWMLRTQSNIDLSYQNSGLTLDSGAQFNLEELDNATNIRISKQYQDLIAALQDASSIQVSLGFWPTWPMTEIQSTEVSVKHFQTAYKAWQSCNQLISAL